jgi:hypothetical protein
MSREPSRKELMEEIRSLVKDKTAWIYLGKKERRIDIIYFPCFPKDLAVCSLGLSKKARKKRARERLLRFLWYLLKRGQLIYDEEGRKFRYIGDTEGRNLEEGFEGGIWRRIEVPGTLIQIQILLVRPRR